MKVAIVGSRHVAISELGRYLPDNTTEIISGGARGMDTCAREYAKAKGLALTRFRPEYKKYGRAAQFTRKLQIIDYADVVIAFWDGTSRGTRYVIDQCVHRRKELLVYVEERPGRWILALRHYKC